ncbi:DUF202 domain-containing protein [Phytohabitans sp. ZYX-F-186]|uniref:DUF202 domain-containing protein n=1 Tax=Phytohabitans maris TaxID=3071409 RepID=A0ABU0ZBK0_9ACTN|nr:DUF202 domain-containing protein [Phytohabitans sp. ZYX-F-186]MDQ7903692.1 DUF202 domain-containing protein [Phytohabitans sp. ZYX-F-186]
MAAVTGSGSQRDPGLQPERTLLSWWRTALAVTAGGAVLLRYATPHTAPTVAAAGALAAAALATLLCARSRAADHRAGRLGAPPPRLVLGLTAATVTAGASAAALVLLA